MWIHSARLTRVASIHFLSQLFTSTIYPVRACVCVSVSERSLVQLQAEMGHTPAPFGLFFALLRCNEPSFLPGDGHHHPTVCGVARCNKSQSVTVNQLFAHSLHPVPRPDGALFSQCAAALLRNTFACRASCSFPAVCQADACARRTITHIDALPWLKARVKDNRGG